MLNETNQTVAIRRGSERSTALEGSHAPMIDLIYIVVTIAFFALMLAYVRGCERLGRDSTDTTEKAP